MKVALLADAQNRHTYRWARWLSSQGLEVHLLSDRAPRESFDLSGITVHRPEWTFWRNLWAFKVHGGAHANSRFKYLAWRGVIERLGPDIIHAHEAKGYGPTLAHLHGTPKVLTPWGPDVETLTDPGSEPAALVRRALHAADVITTNGPGLEAHWSALSGVPRERFDLWSWGIDIARFSTERTDEDAALERRRPELMGKTVILSPRLPNAYYNVNLILRAWDAAVAQRPALRESARLVVLRCGVADAVWAPVASGIASLTHSCTVVVEDSYLSESAMAAYYRRATATVMLPRTDLLSMSLLEAMGCGSLPIVSDLAVHQATLDPLGTDTARPTAMMLRGVELEALAGAFLRATELEAHQRLEIARRNRAAVERDHDWSRCAPRLLSIYEKLLK